MTFDNYTIRQIYKEDSENYFSFVNSNRSRIATYFPISASATKNIRATTAHVAERIQKAERKEFITFIIVDNTTQKIIGTVFLKDIDWSIPKCELGFFIDKNYEGRGIITKSITLLISYCFNILNLNKVFMRIAEGNHSSRRVAEKSGFMAEGVIRRDFKTFEGNLIDVVYYGLLRQIL